MKRISSFAAGVSLAAMISAGAAYADPVITVHPWLAPNAYGSPSYAAAVQNAISAYENGATSWGTPGTPTYYQDQTGPVTSDQVIVTGFNSWMGKADPGTVYGPAFANELGNRMTFGLVINGNGSQFSISQLSLVMDSNDPADALDYSYATGGYNYSNQYVGIQFGGNGALGGGDDTLITGGSNTQLVDMLVGRGSGNSFAAYCTGCTVDAQQAAIDSAAAYPGTPFDFTGTYSLSGFTNAITGSGTFHVNPAPEPLTLSLMGAGLAGLGLMKRRKSAAAA